MKTWVKLYNEINRDPKHLTLTWEERGVWSALLALAGELDDRDENDKETGKLDTIENTALRIRCELDLFKSILSRLMAKERGLVVEDGGVLRIINWSTYLPTNARSQSAIARWRDAVFQRDNYTCQNCGARGVKLNAHHIKPWCLDSQLRFALPNGTTLCVACHKACHSRGWKRRARRDF